MIDFLTVSLGDSENDIEMLNYCDYSGIVKREDKKNCNITKCKLFRKKIKTKVNF